MALSWYINACILLLSLLILILWCFSLCFDVFIECSVLNVVVPPLTSIGIPILVTKSIRKVTALGATLAQTILPSLIIHH